LAPPPHPAKWHLPSTKQPTQRRSPEISELTLGLGSDVGPLHLCQLLVEISTAPFLAPEAASSLPKKAQPLVVGVRAQATPATASTTSWESGSSSPTIVGREPPEGTRRDLGVLLPAVDRSHFPGLRPACVSSQVRFHQVERDRRPGSALAVRPVSARKPGARRRASPATPSCQVSGRTMRTGVSDFQYPGKSRVRMKPFAS
jgi:hypothetical protein